MKWQEIDNKFAYDGPLGPVLHEDGTASLKLWSPSADQINVCLYDKEEQHKLIGKIPMGYTDRGVWQANLLQEQLGIKNHEGYFYHYEIIRQGQAFTGLDPYAKSLAAWNIHDREEEVAKAAIINPAKVGPENSFAQIENYNKREDALIYEVHVRDFTSDPTIAEDLEHPFGTFKAFIERLDYIQSLGVTHIQLLPILSYFNVNELENHIRYMQYKSAWSNYNWGYDPQHYFALTGVYSTDPQDPYARIAEFKSLVNEIHQRGMGVTLDVVYNHTGRLHLLENLEPGYYYFMNKDGSSRENFGGGRLGSTHYMTRRIIIDSLKYLVEEFKVDGFRFDMMGDLDAETIQLAYDEIAAINPKTLFIGEGWITYVGDEGYEDVQAADQKWMKETQDVASFSDDFRDELKSGYETEGRPMFLSGGPRQIEKIFNNIKAQPHNFIADQPGDAVQYIEAHDNMTFHDVIAFALRVDPEEASQEIHQRIRLGNLLLLTSQGIAFVHAGQEYGRTKQFKHPDYQGATEKSQMIPDNSTYISYANGEPIKYPYFIHDSYNSSDAVNLFDWSKALATDQYPIHTQTVKYTQGLIHLRRAFEAFRIGDKQEIDRAIRLIEAPEIADKDLVISYEICYQKDNFIIIVNADSQSRSLSLNYDWTDFEVLVDAEEAGIKAIDEVVGLEFSTGKITIEALTGLILKHK